MIKAIFFDFDGTISDAKKIAEDSLILTLDKFGYEYDKKKAFKLLGIKMRLMLKELGIDIRDVEKIREIFYGYFIKMAKEGKIRQCVSLKPLWKIKRDIPLIVVSNSDIDFLMISIKTLKIEGLFDRIYGAEKKIQKDEILRRLFEEMRISPREAIYVGDRFSDIKFARKIGCIAIAIHNKCSFSTLEEIKREKPNFIVKNFYELKKILEKLNN